MASSYRNSNFSDQVPQTWDGVKIGILYDIREELRTLNLALSCSSVKAIPSLLTAIAKNTKRKKKRP